eukprot:scaffold270989_cov21-Prasinocladus_malaysianus.AAC.1
MLRSNLWICASFMVGSKNAVWDLPAGHATIDRTVLDEFVIPPILPTQQAHTHQKPARQVVYYTLRLVSSKS